MSRKIFKAVWTASGIVFFVSMIFIMAVFYDYFSGVQKDRLHMETEFAAKGVELSGEAYFNNLNMKGYRITWISSDGTVIYDNEADIVQMKNHLNRKEVVEALETGFGEASRYSDTLADKQLYAAKRLEDGSILRLSIMQEAIWKLFLKFLKTIAFVAFIALILSLILASRLTKKIIEPINNIDPDKPEQYYDKENYREVEPLLRRISHQQKELIKDKTEIEKTAQLRQEFTANVSHELKTPLHAISGYAELLENDMVKSDDIKPFVSKIRKESARMTKLIEETIELTKLDSGGPELKWENCDFYQIAENAVDALRYEGDALGVRISILGEKVYVYGVPRLLYSIVYNLCDNAIKYNYKGGEVNLNIAHNENDVILTVQDTGCGISSENLERIFERFFRVDKSRSKEVGGTGLGLSIVKHAIKIHGGTIEAKSEKDKGSEFIVTLPLSSDNL